MKHDGITNLDIVSDFDFTLTRKEYERQGGDASFGVLCKSPYSTKEYKEDTKKLYDHYAPLERSQLISHEEKSKLMDEWYTANLDMISKQNFTELQMTESCYFARIAYRHGFLELSQYAMSNGVPFYVMSAGVKIVIDSMMKEVLKEPALIESAKVITNYEVVESDGQKKYKRPVVTTTNKSVHFNAETYPALKKNVIVCGDNIEDLKMVEKTNHKSVLKFGYFNKILNVSA